MNTYYVKSPYLDTDILLRRGNWKPHSDEDKVDLIVIERGKTIEGLKNFYDMEVGIENYSMIEGIDKYNLIKSYLNEEKENKYVMKQIPLNPKKLDKEVLNFFEDDKIYMVKPVDSGKGEGIFIVKNIKDLEKKYHKLQKTHGVYHAKLKRKNKVSWLLQEYIDRPMLWKGRKFHIRSYYIITVDRKIYFSKIAFIVSAKKKYINDNYGDKDIHDSHYDINNEVLFCKESHIGFTDEQYEKMNRAIKKFHKTLIPKLKIKCYPGVNFCFEILGSDIMFTENGDLKFLELNKEPAIFEKTIPFYNYLFEGIMQEIIDKKFPPNIKQKKNNNIIKL